MASPAPKNPDPAPALTRGLRVLELLAIDGHASLDSLARKTGWPKSSLLRYLQALETSGAARQDPASKAWEALRSLQPVLAATASNALEPARRQLSPLAEATRHCVELYRATPSRVELIDRAEPELADVTLVARIGFVRDLRELDATAKIFYAFASQPLPPQPLWRWRAGRKTRLAHPAAAKALAAARREGVACDDDFNSNGIRRFAAPLLNDLGALVGIVSIAQRQTHRAARETDALVRALAQAFPLPPQPISTTSL